MWLQVTGSTHHKWHCIPGSCMVCFISTLWSNAAHKWACSSYIYVARLRFSASHIL